MAQQVSNQRAEMHAPEAPSEEGERRESMWHNRCQSGTAKRHAPGVPSEEGSAGRGCGGTGHVAQQVSKWDS